jgi:hypothetical protein
MLRAEQKSKNNQMEALRKESTEFLSVVQDIKVLSSKVKEAETKV